MPPGFPRSCLGGLCSLIWAGFPVVPEGFNAVLGHLARWFYPFGSGAHCNNYYHFIVEEPPFSYREAYADREAATLSWHYECVTKALRFSTLGALASYTVNNNNNNRCSGRNGQSGSGLSPTRGQ
jgi:hypothetical protein